MNELEFAWSVRAGDGRSTSRRRFLDLVVDGASLRESIGFAFDAVTPFTVEWSAGPNADALRPSSRHGDDPLLATHECALLTCAECGDTGCGAVVATVSVTDQVVSWSDFRWVQAGDLTGDDVPVESASFRFARAAYDSVVADALTRLDDERRRQPRVATLDG